MSFSLEEIISAQRFGPYRKAAGQDLDRALQLYAWNMKIGAGFLPLFCAVEIGLRNLIVRRLAEVYCDPWWQDATFFRLLEKKGVGIVKRAEERIKQQSRITSRSFIATFCKTMQIAWNW